MAVALCKVLGDLPDEGDGAVPGDEAADVFVVGSVQGARDGLPERRVLEQGVPRGAAAREGLDDGDARSAAAQVPCAPILRLLGSRLEALLLGGIAVRVAVVGPLKGGEVEAAVAGLFGGEVGKASEGLVARGDAAGGAAGMA